MNTLELKTLPELPFDVTEALNQLRVNLEFCGSDVKTIMITSSTPNEGKSYVALNLWRAIANMGHRVLLIDADIRNSEMRTKYGIRSNSTLHGITHYLAGKIELDDAVYKTNVANGYMIPMTVPAANPPILLSNGRLGKIIETYRDQFDYILVDTPPLTVVADAMQIGPYCDGTVLVVRGGVTSRKLVDRSVQMAQKIGIPLLGVVMNRVEYKVNSGGYYYKRYYGYDKDHA